MMNPSQWKAGDCLFVFGSLMDTEVLELVSGQSGSELSIRSATARGFRQYEVVEESYPVLVADDAADCSGLLVGDLTIDAISRILFFEGDEYTLEEISVIESGGSVDKIERAYYFKDAGVYSVRSEPWSYEQWIVHHKPSFIDATAGYMKLYGLMSATEADAHWLELASRAEVANQADVPGGMIDHKTSDTSLATAGMPGKIAS